MSMTVSVQDLIRSTSLPKLLFVVLAVTVLAYISKRRKQSSRPPLPPGPPAHWLFGNELPKVYPARQFYKWTTEYGPLFSLRKGRNLFVIIGEQQAAMDIMEKENAALVDRPDSIAAGKIMSGDKRILLIGQGERFRKLRKALQSQLHIKVVEAYEPIQTKSAKTVILDILSEPELHQQHVKRYAASVIMSLTYGKTTPTSYSDPEVQEVNKCIARLGVALRPGTYLVDSYPFLQYVPGYSNTLKRYYLDELALFKSQLEGVRQKMMKQEAQPCFAKYLLERQQEFELSDDELAYLAGSMFGAGSDTSASAISTVIMAAACFPDAQCKVQEQLDAVIGHDRVPSFGDMEELTEVTAFIQESYRWRPVSAGGFPHRATRDITYGGYVIPAGATVIANHWALSRDPAFFPDGEKFIPSRWLTELGTINDKLKYYNFGFGRRVCPGQHIANRSLFINTALLLWSFNISQDPHYPIDTLAYTDTANTHPLPFHAKFEPRIPNLRERLKENWEL